MAVGALEPQFFEDLLSVLEIDRSAVPEQMDREGWPRMRESFASIFVTRTQEEWVEAFQGRDACVAPVLALSEAPAHPHNVARGSFVEVGGVIQPAPAPRFSGTPAPPTRRPRRPGDSTDSVLDHLGYSQGEIGKLRADSVVG
jgi:alpha-methylacyl-CoA racemase